MNTISEIISESLYADKTLAPIVDEYLQTGDSGLARQVTLNSHEWAYDSLAADIISAQPQEADLLRLIHFFVELSILAQTANDDKHILLKGLFDFYLSKRHIVTPSDSVIKLIREKHSNLKSFALYFLEHSSAYNLLFPNNESPDADNPFQSPAANIIWQQIDESFAEKESIFTEHTYLFAALSNYRPDFVKIWANSPPRAHTWEQTSAWCHLIKASSDFDNECLSFCAKIQKTGANHAFRILDRLNDARNNEHLKTLIKCAKLPCAIQAPEAINIGLTHFPDELLSLFAQAMAQPGSFDFVPSFDCDEYRALFSFAISNWEPNGAAMFTHFATAISNYRFSELLTKSEIPLPPVAYPVLREVTKSRHSQLKGNDRAELWNVAISNYPDAFEDDLFDLLTGKSKPVREIAAKGLSELKGQSCLPKAIELLGAKTADTRLGAIELLKQLGESGIPALKAAHAAEKSQKVQGTIEEALASLGEAITTIEEELSTEDLLAQVESNKRIKLPKADWFDLSKFPLIQKDGTPLSEKAITFLIQKQAKHKTIDAAPGILPVLELLDREKNADSALDLLNQWLDSNQEAKDRWALVFAGLLGDNRVIPALTPRIQPWCENARHKLAEYAAQAISLLATEEALMILDTLANRYRSRFKNIGKACTAAFLAAAEARGVSADELGDLVVPNLGFNSECHKEFDEGKIVAVLQPDFKITWLNPETEKETKSPPSTLSPEGKEELKTLRKILREAVKGQTARLEQMLVRQRRWPVARWQELFEEHPLLQSYAASLVWGIYDSKNELLRTFRRYPNGILAHGSGEMEDLEERDTQIGIVHPLELDDDTLAIWRDHLGRFKVKTPFPQLDRPVEILDKDHGNRREITFTENVQISGGTFLSRMNKQGWTRGSIIDGGGVTSYYKPFEGAGVEAILFLEEYWVGFDPMDSFPLGKALFAKLSTVDRGSYTYDDPEPNDPRIIPFGEVPPIVYSETIADLKALIAGQEKS